MEIRNNVEGLRTLLGVPSTNTAQGPQGPQGPPGAPGKSGSSAAAQQLPGDHATLSSAGTQAAQNGEGAGVRMDKVAAVQQALAAGTYSVPGRAVAGKVVDAMLGTGNGSSR
jgi:negative regulator of flagellin synthesis FlgM